MVLLAVGIGVATAKARASARAHSLEEALAPFGLRSIRAAQVQDLLLPTPLFKLNSMTYEAEVDGLRLIVQTQVRFVDRQGNNLGNFIAPGEEGRALQVHFVRLVLDSAGALPKHYALHLHFGHDFNVLGDEAIAAALLDGELRSVTSRGDELSIEDGRVVFESPFLVLQREPRRAVVALARMLRRLSDLLDGRTELRALLLDNLKNDMDPAVRARAAELLRASTDVELAGEAARLALADHDPQVRFAVARHLGDRGFDIIAEIIGTEILHEAVQQRGLRYLCRTFPIERVEPVLTGALHSRSEQLQATAIQMLLELGPASPAPRLLAAVEPRSYFNATRLAEALGAVGGPGAEQTLIKLLYFRARFGLMLDLDMRIAVADALGRVGTLAAVPHLHPFADGALNDENLRLSATTAIELIQGRVGGDGTGGALSLIEPKDDAGKLSVTDERGRVSVPED